MVSYKFENCGCLISDDTNLSLISNHDIQEGIKFCNRTCNKDFEVARCVLSLPSCTNKEYNMIGTDLGITAMKSDENV